MDRQQIFLELTLRSLEMPLCLNSFDDRMAFQKTIYLCQAAGVHLGYWYNWYLRGPYSPDLTRDAFALASKPQPHRDEELAGWNLPPDAANKLATLRQLWSQRPPAEQPRWLELLASVLFLTRSYDGRGKDAEGLRVILEKNDKHFSDAQVADALKELARYGLLKVAA